jgi:hypothetical protein
MEVKYRALSNQVTNAAVIANLKEDNSHYGMKKQLNITSNILSITSYTK